MRKKRYVKCGIITKRVLKQYASANDAAKDNNLNAAKIINVCKKPIGVYGYYYWFKY